MARIEQAIVIPAPLEDVFAFASDYRKWGDWFEGVSEFTPITTITEGNGARYAYKARLLGISVGVETEIHDFRRNEGWKGVATKGVAAQTFWTFRPEGDGTRFTYALEYDLPIPLLGPLVDSMFMKRQWKRIIAKSLENLNRQFIGGS